MTMLAFYEPDEHDKTEAERNRTLAERLDGKLTELYDSPRERARRSQMQFDLELYFGQAIPSLFDVSDSAAVSAFNGADLRFNHCYSICSTVRNRICSFRPRSEFVPQGGDELADRVAEDMSDMNEAWSLEQGRQATMALWFRDLLTCDGGVVKTYRDGKQIDLGRFPAWEFLVDEVEGMYGRTQTIHHVQYLPLETVSARYDVPMDVLVPEATSMAAGQPYYSQRKVVRVADTYVAATSHYKEDDKGGGEWIDVPGHHIVLVGRGTVATNEEWEYDDFPIIIRSFEESITGTWGVSALRMLRGIQLAQNEWTRRMENVHYMSSLQVWQVPEGEDGPTAITNADVRIERFKSRPSVVLNPPPMGPEAYKWCDLLEQQGYKTIGVSPFIAAGVKQPQTSSGVAIDATSELQTDRLALLSQIWEEANNRVDLWWMRLTRMAAKDGVKFTWRAVSKGTWRELAFGDPEREWEVKPRPTSVFGQTVSARLTKATEMLKAGAIDVDEWREVVNLPDLKSLMDVRRADQILMKRIVDRVLEDGDLRMPGPYLPPEKMYEYARARYNLAEADEGKYPAEHMAELSRLVDAMKAQADKANAPPPVPPAPAPAAMPPPAGVPPMVPPPAMPPPLAPPVQ